MAKLAIIHTTAATVEALKALALERMPGVQVVNFVDDSILPELAESGGDFECVAPRIIQYARFAERVGADVVLEACSSVGELVPRMREQLRIPVIRIDEAMAETAVASGERIGVAATLQTTLAPTIRLLESKAAAVGKDISLSPLLVAEAYQKLMAGDRAGHDQCLAEALRKLCASVDVVVLAQASMARVLPSLDEAERGKCLTSPASAMDRVRLVLEKRL